MRRVVDFAGLTIAALSLTSLGGCSSGGGGITGALAPGPLPYQYANAMMPQGYSESQIAPDRYRIDVKGPINTPRDRLEKIAATRAAEIGKENRLGYFKIDGVQQAVKCEKYSTGTQRGGTGTEKKVSAYTILTAEVSYTKSPPDTSYVDSKTAFDQYRAELDQTTVGPGPVDPAALAQCG